MAPSKKVKAPAAPRLKPMAAGNGRGLARRPPSAMIYTLGDSWFTYPTIFDQGAPINLIWALDMMKQPRARKYCFNKSGEPGATSQDLTTGKYWDRLNLALDDPYDFLLVSMGGNDFVGTTRIDGKRHTRFGEYLLKYTDQTVGSDLLNQDAVSKQMDATLANVEKLFQLCEEKSANKSLQIVTHVYDFLIPTDRGASVLDRWQVLGPWMYKDLVDNRVPLKLRPEVPKALLQLYRTRLTELADVLNRRTKTEIKLWIADTQGTLTPGDETQWINEIHPRNQGYKLLAQRFDDVLAPLRDALPPARWREWPH